MYGLFYPPVALFLALPPETAWTWLAILHVVLGGLGMYAFLWDDRRDAAAAACGAVVFALSGFMLQRVLAGHMNLVMPTAWAPWVLFAVARTIRGTRRAAAALGLCAGVGLLAGHAQVWFYVGPLVVAFAAMETTRAKAWRAAAPRFAVAAAIAVGLAAVQWLPAWELFDVTGHPQERREVIEACSATPAALAAQIAPAFAGRSVPLAHEFVGLAGPLAVAAALLALRLRDGRRWFWFAALVVGLVLATGLRTELGRLANELPPFRFARAPGRAMVLVVLAGSVLAAQLVADWLGALPTKLRALAPPAFVASALVFGAPWPDVVRKDFYERDWTSPTSTEHRMHVASARFPYAERFGVKTLRSVCPVDPPGFTAMTPPATPPAVAAWWFDVAEHVELQWDRPPATQAEIGGAALRIRTMRSTPGGGIQTFDEATRVSDDEALRRLRAGERALFLAPETADASWRATTADALRRLRLEPTSDPDRVVLAADAPCAGPVFVSQRWYPGWETAPPSRVARGNVAFLAVFADFPAAGTIEIRYRPWWRVPALVAGGASLALAAWLVLRRATGASTFSRTDGPS
jgi:hypothetical protein